MELIQPYPLEDIVHIRGVDHPESIAVGPLGEAYTTGTGGQVYRVDLVTNTVQQFASTAPRRTCGQAVDADGNLYIADCSTDGKVIRITPDGQEEVYARAPGGRPFVGTNYPVFDCQGNLYLSDAGTYRDIVDGCIYKIAPGGGEAALWYPHALATPNKMALDAPGTFLYFCESHGIARIAINPDGSAGAFERLIHTPYLVPHGLAFDEAGRLWFPSYRPDSLWYFDIAAGRLHLVVEDWMGEALRGPTNLNFAGPDRDILLLSSLDNLVIHRFDKLGARGISLNHPKITRYELPC